MRVLIYSHDTYGLGHFRRSLAIAEALVDARADASVLIVTGSPRVQSFVLPPRCDTMKLPTILKQVDGSYASRDLEISLHEIVAMRSKLIVSAFHDFRPDLVLVDHAPLGVAGELEPLLATMRTDRRGAALALGMRDIIDEAGRIEESWRRDGIMKAVEEDYDRILVYGCEEMETTARELGLDRLHDRHGRPKTRHVGYLARPMTSERRSGRLLVTTGGGGDGQRLLRAFLRFLERGGSFAGPIDIVTGPFLSDRRQREIERRAAALDGDVTVVRFDEALHERIAEASAVIGMAGYNTVTEILAASRPALLVPREEPRQEQLIRARRLAPLTGLRFSRMRELRDRTFADFLSGVEAGTVATRPALRLDGLRSVVGQICALLHERKQDGLGVARFRAKTIVSGGQG